MADLAYSISGNGANGTGNGDSASGNGGNAGHGEGAGWVPVQNRPWEWTEYLGEPSSPLTDSKAGPNPASSTTAAAVEDRSRATVGPPVVIRNTTSLPLELFAVQPTGERILPLPLSSPLTPTTDAVHGGDIDPRVDATLRALQEGTLGESVFKRDWRESRVNPQSALAGPLASRSREPDAQPRQHAGAQAHTHPPTHTRAGSSDGRQGSSTQSSRVASPASASASSARSRAQGSPVTHTHSMFASGSGMGAGTGSGAFSRFTGSSAADPIDVDSLDLPMSLGSTGGGAGGAGAGRGHKRKMEDIAEEEEVRILEGPVLGASEKRAKAGKTKARKR